MRSFSDVVGGLLTQLGWSLWTQLGVSGVERNHEDHAIDPEPLIIYTAALQDADPRLRDESMDWCIRYHTFISKTRLRNLLMGQDESTRKAFGAYAATVNAQAPARWPVSQGIKPRTFAPSGKSTADFSRPSLLRLRARAIFGVGARAEILTSFLAEPSTGKSAVELAAVGYAKRNIAAILAELHSAGLLNAIPVSNRIHYRLARRKPLEKLVEPIPKHFLDWTKLLPFLSAAGTLAKRSERKPAKVTAIAASKLLQRFATDLVGLHGQIPSPETFPEDYWANASDWILRFMRALARGKIPS
jgi:hypothetical protein